LGEANGGQLLAELESNGRMMLELPDGPVVLDSEDIQVRLQAKPGWAAAQGHAVVVVLATELTPDLIREGLARELVRTIQDRRKEMGLEFTDRIVVGVVTDSAELRAAIEQFTDYIRGETLAAELRHSVLPDVQSVDFQVGDAPVSLYVKAL
jgi:isoleucyl-tRNA synthetase